MMKAYDGLAVTFVIQLTHSTLRRPACIRAKLDLGPSMYYEFDPAAAPFAVM